MKVDDTNKDWIVNLKKARVLTFKKLHDKITESLKSDIMEYKKLIY